MSNCDFLGLKPNQEFKIKNTNFKYRFNSKDEMECYNPILGKWRLFSDQLFDILHDNGLIEIVENKVDVKMSIHDTIVLNGLRWPDKKIKKIERESNGEFIRVVFSENFDEGVEEETYITFSKEEIKLDFLEDFNNDVFEIKYDEKDRVTGVCGIEE